MKHIIYEKMNEIGILTINRPQALNALNSEVYREISTVIQKADVDSKVKVLIITGAGGKAFVVGADITEMQNMRVTEAVDFAILGNSLFMQIEDLPKPVIAAIEGFALGGGCELALACDIRVASSKSKLGLPEINLGIIPGNGETQRLPRIIGKAKALEMIWLGAPIGAEEALKIGLINHISEVGEALNKAKELAEKFVVQGQIAMKAAKKAVNYGLNTDIKTGVKHEIALFSGLFATEDQIEGMTAFLEKRPPVFK